MPSLPTSNVRFALNAATKAAVPACDCGAAALHFDGCQAAAGLYDEIDFHAAFAPLEELALAGGRGVGEMGAYRRLHSESIAHLGVGPVGKMQSLETPGETFRQPLCHQEGRGAEQDHLEPTLVASVLIPQPLDSLGPGRRFSRFRPARGVRRLSPMRRDAPRPTASQSSRPP